MGQPRCDEGVLALDYGWWIYIFRTLADAADDADRREELLAYRNMPSLRAYLVEDGNISLECPPDTLLSFAEIYRRIEFAS